jgi:hypothetical protein
MRSGIQLTGSLLNERARLESLNLSASLTEVLDQENIVRNIQRRGEILNKDFSLTIESQASVEYFQRLKSVIDFNNSIIFNEKKEIEDSFGSFIQKVDSKKKAIVSLTNTIRKKLNQLSFLSYREPSVVLLEEFINMSNIDSKTNGDKVRLNIDTNAEVATLPILETETHPIDNCFILNTSNGVPGEYSDGSNKDIFNIFNGRPDSHFTYHRKDNGPLVLVITCSFSSSKIFNKLSIARSDITGSSAFTLKDAVFSKDEINVSIKNLVSLKNQNFKINSYSENEILSIYHLPVEANKITLSFECSEYSTFDTGRKLFSLSIKEINFQKLTYADSGSFTSTIQNIDEDFYACSFKDVVHPKDAVSYSKKLLLSTDRGSTFSQLEDGEDFSLDGKAQSIVYSYEVSRIDSALSRSEYLKSEAYFPDVVSFTKSFARDRENTYVLNNLNKKTLSAYQPDIAFNGSDNNKFVEMPGVVAGGLITLDNFIINNLSSLDFRFYAKGKRLYKAESITKDNQYRINSKNELEVHSSLNGSKVSFACKVGAKIISKPEGFYAEFLISDFDLNKIEVNKLIIKEDEIESVPDTKKDMIKYTFKAYDSSGDITNYTVADIDHLNGKLETLPYKAKYNYYERERVETWKLWFDNEVPKGIFFGEGLPVEKVDFKYNSTSRRYDHDTGIVEYITNDLDRKKVSFPDRDIIVGSVRINPDIFRGYKFEEVPYIDGVKEFLKLNSITESLPPIEKDEDGFVYFALTKTPATSIEVYRSNIRTRTATVTNNICKVKLENEDDISYNYKVIYSYSEETPADTKLYSIDYKEGHAHFKDDIFVDDNLLLSYGVFHGVIEYYSVNPLSLNSEEIDQETGIVKHYIDSSDVISRNNNIKFSWFKNKSSVIVEDLKKHYSPVIYSTRLELK